MNKRLLLKSICMILIATGCTTPTLAPLPPTAPPTKEVSIAAPSATPSVATSEPKLQTRDLSPLMDAWNSRNIQSIKALYSEDASILSEVEAGKLESKTPVVVEVSEELINGYLQSIPQSMTMHIIGEPVVVYDKLVAYFYRIEDATEGYNAAGLLRFEGDKIYQHVFLVSGKLTSNATTSTESSLEAPIGQMMEAWSKSDLKAAATLYSKDAIILSDEDLAQVQWRDYTVPPSLDQLLSQFSGWNPELISPPVQLEDITIFSWRWSIRDYPVGYGVRLVKYQNGVITVDIRYAIRPWEASGKEFISGG